MGCLVGFGWMGLIFSGFFLVVTIPMHYRIIGPMPLGRWLLVYFLLFVLYMVIARQLVRLKRMAEADLKKSDSDATGN